jgi:hypothetical protein
MDMNVTRRMRGLALGTVLLATLTTAGAAFGLLSSAPAGASSGPPTAPGTYTIIETEVTPMPSTHTGTLTIAANGTFSETSPDLPGGVCDGVWTASKTSIALQVSGSTAGHSECIGTGTDLVLVGHLSKKGIKAGTSEAWQVDGAGNPTTFAATGIWSAVKH